LIDQRWFYEGLGVSTPSPAAGLILFMLVVPVFLCCYSLSNAFAAPRVRSRPFPPRMPGDRPRGHTVSSIRAPPFDSRPVALCVLRSASPAIARISPPGNCVTEEIAARNLRFEASNNCRALCQGPLVRSSTTASATKKRRRSRFNAPASSVCAL
jgi:hypothetical protein